MAVTDNAERPNGGVVNYRITRAEKDIERLDHEKADAKDVQVIAAEVRGLRKVLIAFLVSVSSSAVLFAFAVNQIVHH